MDKHALRENCAASARSAWFRQDRNSIHILESSELDGNLAKTVVGLIREALSHRAHAIVTTSTGRTLRSTYALLRDNYKDALDWTRVVCVQMDEYEGIGAADPRSTASELLREFVVPLGINRFVRFYDDGGQPSCSLDEYQQQLEMLGGLDCAFHGVGRNAHIGFNEPATALPFETRAVTLAESTRLANGVAFAKGVTLGLDILRRAKASLVVLRGTEKRSAARALLFDPIGPGNPAAYLRSCSRISVYLDREAVPEGQRI